MKTILLPALARAGAARGAVLGLALLAAAPAQAQKEPESTGGPMLGGEVEAICLGGNKATASICTAFLRGTFEGLMFGQLTATGGMTSFCLPSDGVTPSDLRDTFLEFVGDMPGRRSEEAGLLMLDSLQDRYPCADEEEEPEPLVGPDDVLEVPITMASLTVPWPESEMSNWVAWSPSAPPSEKLSFLTNS